MKILLFALNGSYSHTCLAVYCLRGALEKAGFTLCGRITLIGGSEDGDPRLAYEFVLK